MVKTKDRKKTRQNWGWRPGKDKRRWRKGKCFSQMEKKKGRILRSGNSTYLYFLMCLWTKTRRYKMRKWIKNVSMFKALSFCTLKTSLFDLIQHFSNLFYCSIFPKKKKNQITFDIQLKSMLLNMVPWKVVTIWCFPTCPNSKEKSSNQQAFISVFQWLACVYLSASEWLWALTQATHQSFPATAVQPGGQEHSLRLLISLNVSLSVKSGWLYLSFVVGFQ